MTKKEYLNKFNNDGAVFKARLASAWDAAIEEAALALANAIASGLVYGPDTIRKLKE